jgi:hypothetical protein
MNLSAANLAQQIRDIAIAATDVSDKLSLRESRRLSQNLAQAGPVMPVPNASGSIDGRVIDHGASAADTGKSRKFCE